jgi:hypothetical protein
VVSKPPPFTEDAQNHRDEIAALHMQIQSTPQLAALIPNQTIDQWVYYSTAEQIVDNLDVSLNIIIQRHSQHEEADGEEDREEEGQ